MSGAELAALLERQGFEFFTGVPWPGSMGLAAAIGLGLAAAVRDALTGPGPWLVLAKVTPEEADAARIPHAPRQIRDRFRASVGAPSRPGGA